jgi:hypothetical protein
VVLDNEVAPRNGMFDRFIPQRVGEISSSIYQASQCNSHEIELISKQLKISKKTVSEPMPQAPAARPLVFNERGLVHQRLSDAVSHYNQHSLDEVAQFNEERRSGLTPEEADNTALFGNRLGLGGCSPNYHNIFGSLNNYDQAMSQIG